MRPANSSAHAMQSVLIVGFVLICSAGPLRAQDPVKVAPNHFKVLLENERVRVLDFHAKQGEKIGMHSHPDYITYPIASAGKTKFTSPDGKVTEQPASVGRATYHDAETHASEYVGPGKIHVLLVELKGPAPGNQ